MNKLIGLISIMYWITSVVLTLGVAKCCVPYLGTNVDGVEGGVVYSGLTLILTVWVTVL